ncbi:MAG: MFS transporter [Alphaproteobacteria bacterium]
MPRLPDYTGATVLFTVVQGLLAMATAAGPVVALAMLGELGLSTAWIGAYAPIVYGAAMFSSPASADLITRYGAVRVSQVALLSAAAGLTLMGLGSTALVAVGAAIVGAAYGPGTPASSHVLARIVPPARQPLVFSIKQTGVPLGTAAAGFALPPIVVAVGWHAALFAAAAACVVAALLITPLRRRIDADRQPGSGRMFDIIGPLRLVLSSRGLRLLMIGCLALGLMQMCFVNFYVAFLEDSAGFSKIAAGALFGIAGIAGAAGRIFWGGVSGALLSPTRTLTLICVIVAAITVAVTQLSADWPFFIAAALSAAFGATAMGWNGVYLAEVARLAPPGAAGRATGGMGVAMFGGVLFAPPVFGVILALSGYGAAFLVAGAAVLAGALPFVRASRIGRRE